MLEPDNHTQLVIEDSDGELTPIWRNDEVAQGMGQDDERWFDGANDPVSWREILRYAVKIHGLTTIATTEHGPTDVHTHFGLSYANYQVLHRTLMQSMPAEWQHRMVAALDELERAFRHVEKAPAYEVTPGRDCYVNELDEVQLKRAGITTAVKETSSIDTEVRYYDRDGNELDDIAHVIVPLPGGDPVPHYNQGRTRIEPKSED